MSGMARPRTACAAAALGLALLAGGCRSVRGIASSPPPAEPSGREGWVAYRVGQLRVEAPASWRASGREQALRLEEPDGRGRLEVSVRGEAFADARSCLAAAEASLERGEEQLERVRRHATKIAGVPAVTQEADQGPWHGWAWAACDGGVQYRIFFTAVSTAPAEVMEVHRALLSARMGGTS